jgi:protein-S-isoprenylcysteine O-methyltransferase Ste14
MQMPEDLGLHAWSSAFEPGWRWGISPLPEAHLALIAIGVVLGFVKPLPLGLSSPGASILGAALMFLGMVVMIWATRTTGRMTLADDAQLITDGPYQLSRHSMYVAWTVFYLGLLLLLDSGWLLVLIPILTLWIQWESGNEERRLIESFGPAYVQYQDRVRRYL